MAPHPPPASGHRMAGARLHRSGAEAQRVLLLGDRAYVGADEPVRDRLADGVAARTGAGLDLDVVWDLVPALRAVAASTEAWRLWRYEAVVVLVQAADLRTASRWWGGRLPRLAGQVLPELADSSAVLAVRLDDRDHGGTTEDALLVDEPAVRSTTVRIGADGGLLDPGPQVDGIAAVVANLLVASAGRAVVHGGGTAAERRAEPEPEPDRQRAVDHVSESLGGINPHLERVVLLARNTFDVPYAQVNLVDHGRVRTLAFVGMRGEDASQPVCAITVRGSGPTIIPDTWLDERLDHNPHVHGDRPVRFYAAHPIESLDGYRVGTLCVFDLKPHDVGDVDPAVLRDLALLAEAEISRLPED